MGHTRAGYTVIEWQREHAFFGRQGRRRGPQPLPRCSSTAHRADSRGPGAVPRFRRKVQLCTWYSREVGRGGESRQRGGRELRLSGKRVDCLRAVARCSAAVGPCSLLPASGLQQRAGPSAGTSAALLTAQRRPCGCASLLLPVGAPAAARRRRRPVGARLAWRAGAA